MKRPWLWIVLLLSLGVNIGVLATIGVTRLKGQPPWQRPAREGPPPLARLADRLDLRGEPRERFLTLQRELFETTRRHREHLEELRGELRRELRAEEPDSARVEELISELGDAYESLDRALIGTILESRKILTPEQMERYFHLLERIRAAAWGPRGPGPRRRPPRSPRR